MAPWRTSFMTADASSDATVVVVGNGERGFEIMFGRW